MVFENKNYNLIPYIGIVFTVGVSLWAYLNDLQFGTIYIALFLTPLVLLFVLTLFINETDKKGFLSNLKFPLTTSTPTASIMVLFGWISFLIIQVVGSFFQFSIVSFIIPLTAKQSSILIQQTATQLSVTTSNGMSLFITTMIASFLEELAFGWVGVTVLFVLVGYIIEQLISKKVSKTLQLPITLTVLAVIFASLHSFNSTYGQFQFNNFATWQPYIVASFFRIIMSGLIYYSGATLSFVIGFHQMNNLVWYIQNNGWTQFLSALASFPGLIMISYFVFIIWIVLNNVGSINKAFSMIIKGFGRTQKN